LGKDDALETSLRMAEATRLMGRILIEYDLSESDQAAAGEILKLIAQRLSDVAVSHFSS
jgi:hypothetical protein